MSPRFVDIVYEQYQLSDTDLHAPSSLSGSCHLVEDVGEDEKVRDVAADKSDWDFGRWLNFYGLERTGVQGKLRAAQDICHANY